MDDDFDFTDYIDILNDDVSQTGTDPTTGAALEADLISHPSLIRLAVASKTLADF